MASFAAFITTKYIKDNTPALGYINDDELRTFIRPAQDQYIERVLGSNLYKALITSVIGNTVSTDEDVLLRQYIQPSLQYWTIYEYVLWSNYKLTNKSVSLQNSDNSNPAEFNQVIALKNNIRDWAEFYTERISNFLKDNPNLYPEYYSGNSGFSDKHPKSDNYMIFGGLYIPRQFGSLCPSPMAWDDIKLYW
jgi:hypothetical protein